MTNTKKCTQCDLTKDLSQFGKRSKLRDVLKSACKECELARSKQWEKANPMSNASRKRAHELRNPEKTKIKRRERNLKEYGITEEEYNAMLTNQGDRCAICKRHKSDFIKALAVDHCHKTGRVRGILCMPCNRGLGYFKDNPELTLAATDYLKAKST